MIIDLILVTRVYRLEKLGHTIGILKSWCIVVELKVKHNLKCIYMAYYPLYLKVSYPQV